MAGWGTPERDALPWVTARVSPPRSQAVTAAGAAPGGCEAGAAGASWTEGGPAGCSEAAAAETEGDSEVAGAWTEVATEEAAGEEEEEAAPGDPRDP